MMKRSRIGCCVLALAALLGVASAGSAQMTGLENGEWHYLGGDAGHTRSNPQLKQINASNFSDLQVAWTWRGDNFGPSVEYTFRSTPVFVDGVLYTVVGQRRQVVAINAATGETLWVFREPETMRYRRSPRTDFGKGVAYGESNQVFRQTCFFLETRRKVFPSHHYRSHSQQHLQRFYPQIHFP